MASKGPSEITSGPTQHAKLVANQRRKRRLPWLWAPPVLVGLASLLLKIELSNVSGILTAVGLFSAAMLGVFVQLASWRVKFSERIGRFRHTEAPSRDRLDAAVHKTLTATVVSMILAASLVGVEFRPALSLGYIRQFFPFLIESAPVLWLQSQRELIFLFISAACIAGLAWLLIIFVFIAADLRSTYNSMIAAEEAEAKELRALKRHREQRGA
jgi:hypothetical protein